MDGVSRKSADGINTQSEDKTRLDPSTAETNFFSKSGNKDKNDPTDNPKTKMFYSLRSAIDRSITYLRNLRTSEIDKKNHVHSKNIELDLIRSINRNDLVHFKSRLESCQQDQRELVLNKYSKIAGSTVMLAAISSNNRDFLGIVSHYRLDSLATDCHGSSATHLAFRHSPSSARDYEEIDEKIKTITGERLFSDQNLRKTNKDGQTPAAYAASQANAAGVWFSLFKQRENLTIEDYSKVLIEAIKAQDVATVDNVLVKSRDAVTHHDNTSTESALQITARLGNDQVFKTIFCHAPNGLRKTNREKRNIAHIAVENNAVNIIAHIPDGHDCFLDKDMLGRTPLSLAKERGNIELINLLIKKTKSPYS